MDLHGEVSESRLERLSRDQDDAYYTEGEEPAEQVGPHEQQ